MSIIKTKISELMKTYALKQLPKIIMSKQYIDLYNDILKETSILGDNVEKFSERLFIIMNDMKDRPICKSCTNHVSFKGYNKGYADFCSVKCSRNNSETNKKIEESCMLKYGVRHYSQSDEVKKKKEDTFMKRYGVKTSLQDPKTKEKIKQTNLKKYGVEYAGASLEAMNKAKKTNQEKYGEDYTFQSELIKEKIRDTNIERYGTETPILTDEVQNKIKKTNQEKYGVDYTFQSKEIQDKIKDTNIKRYGTLNLMQLYTIQNKIKRTNLIRYNTEHIFNSEEFKEKIRDTNFDKYNVSNPGKIIKIKNFDKYKQLSELFNIDLLLDKNCNYNYKCNNCGEIGEISTEDIYNRGIRYGKTFCKTCLPQNSGISGVENSFLEFVKEITINSDNVIQSDRNILDGKEIDIYIPDVKLGIEINGLYRHNDSKIVDKNYHYNKTQLAKSKGVQLLHFFDDEIKQGMMLVYSILANKGALKDNFLNIEGINTLNEKYDLDIFPLEQSKFRARKLILKSHNLGDTGEKKKYKNFLEKYHIQGADNAKYYYSLELKGENGNNDIILSLMTFKSMSVDKNQKRSNSNNINEITFELSRYVTIPGIQIIGGFNRLLGAFKKDLDRLYPLYKITLLTYSNLRYSDEDNNVYIRNGFNKIGFTGINYYYFFEGKKMHRFNFRKNNLYDKILPERGISVEPDYLKESENGMVQKLNDNGFPVNKVYDCGHLKWELFL